MPARQGERRCCLGHRKICKVEDPILAMSANNIMCHWRHGCLHVRRQVIGLCNLSHRFEVEDVSDEFSRRYIPRLFCDRHMQPSFRSMTVLALVFWLNWKEMHRQIAAIELYRRQRCDDVVAGWADLGNRWEHSRWTASS